MFGVADYQQIRTNELPVLGLNTSTDSLAEFTKLRWTLCGGVARKTQFEKPYCVNYEKSEFQKLCSRDVLGLGSRILETFKDHIKYCKKGITKLHYHGNRIIHLYLATNS